MHAPPHGSSLACTCSPGTGMSLHACTGAAMRVHACTQLCCSGEAQARPSMCMSDPFLHARQAKMPRKWKYVVVAVVGAHVVIALILAAGSKRTALLGGVRMSALGNMSRADAWNPQVRRGRPSHRSRRAG